jgi:hypothetical protein
VKLQLSGRLGNQLFQFAYAHEMYRIFQSPVQLVYDNFHRDKNERFDLVSENLNCKKVLAPIEDNNLGTLVKMLDKIGRHSNKQIQKHLQSMLSMSRQLDSHNFNFIFKKEPRFITGFYINKDYVLKNESEIISDIQPTLSHKFSQVSQLIEKKALEQFQMMHIRRGDYQKNPDLYGLLKVDYYRNLREEMPLILAVENENDCAEFIEVLKPDLVLSKDNSDAWQTLAVMQQAKNLVISNSTFAWWGGFFAANNGGTVTMPVPFYKSSHNSDKFLNYDLFTSEFSDFI